MGLYLGWITRELAREVAKRRENKLRVYTKNV